MALPLLQTPEFETTLPSTGESILFRPFLVKEEKILFMALQGGDQHEMVNAVKNILGACVLSPEYFNVENITMYDVEYLFLKLRGKSVGEQIDLKVRHPNSECTHVSDVSINLDEVKVKFPENYNDTIQLTDSIGIKMRPPGISSSLNINQDDPGFDDLMNLIAQCVVMIYDNDSVYEDFTQEEVVSFLEGLNQSQFTKIQEFLASSPKLSHTITWTCEKCGETETLTVEGLNNFFT
jgi:undecaprenyl pyrophosphate synthase